MRVFNAMGSGARIMMIPVWMKNAEEPAGAGRAGMRRARFLDKATLAFTELAREFFFQESADGGGLLQNIHPGAKLLSVFIMVFVSTLVRSVPALAALAALPLILAGLSSINPARFAARAWLSVPLFTAGIALPAIFNIFVDGTPLFTIWELDGPVRFGPWSIPQAISVTREGVHSALLLVMRATAAVSFVSILMTTTRWNLILRSISAARIPAVFTLILGMTYRYIFMLVRTAEEMFMARKSRTIVPGNSRRDRRWVASRMGFIIGKSIEMSREIHMSMISRGFSGEAKFQPGEKAKARDYGFAILIIIAAGAILLADGRF